MTLDRKKPCCRLHEGRCRPLKTSSLQVLKETGVVLISAHSLYFCPVRIGVTSGWLGLLVEMGAMIPTQTEKSEEGKLPLALSSEAKHVGLKKMK